MGKHHNKSNWLFNAIDPFRHTKEAKIWYELGGLGRATNMVPQLMQDVGLTPKDPNDITWGDYSKLVCRLSVGPPKGTFAFSTRELKEKMYVGFYKPPRAADRRSAIEHTQKKVFKRTLIALSKNQWARIASTLEGWLVGALSINHLLYFVGIALFLLLAAIFRP